MSTAADRAPRGAAELRRARRAAAGSFIGAVVKWYDFLLYGIVAALVFAELFFPGYSAHAGTLAAFATFGVGFIFRFLGGIVFGHFGDRLDRKSMLIRTMTIMGVATALIGLLPTYQSVGWLAPSQAAPFFSSGMQIGYSFGLLLTTGLVALLSSNFSQEAFLTWAGGSPSSPAPSSSSSVCGSGPGSKSRRSISNG